MDDVKPEIIALKEELQSLNSLLESNLKLNDEIIEKNKLKKIENNVEKIGILIK